MADFQNQVGKTFLYSHTDFSLSHSHTAVIKVKKPTLVFKYKHTHTQQKHASCWKDVYSAYSQTRPRKILGIYNTQNIDMGGKCRKMQLGTAAHLWRRQTCPRCSRTRHLSWVEDPSRKHWWAWGTLALPSYLSPAKTSGPGRQT